jgi:hypothetical protein
LSKYAPFKWRDRGKIAPNRIPVIDITRDELLEELAEFNPT